MRLISWLFWEIVGLIEMIAHRLMGLDPMVWPETVFMAVLLTTGILWFRKWIHSLKKERKKDHAE